MGASQLIQLLSNTTAYRKHRMATALWVLEHPEMVEALLRHIVEDTTEVSYKAAWVLEFVYLKKPEVLYPHFDYFFANLAVVKRDQAVRPMAHICEILCVQYYKKMDPELQKRFTPAHKSMLTECAFDWLISDQKVACKVRAMTSLYYLGTEFDWIHSELKQHILLHMHAGSAGYKARGKQTLELIRKFKSR